MDRDKLTPLLVERTLDFSEPRLIFREDYGYGIPSSENPTYPSVIIEWWPHTEEEKQTHLNALNQYIDGVIEALSKH